MVLDANHAERRASTFCNDNEESSARPATPVHASVQCYEEEPPDAGRFVLCGILAQLLWPLGAMYFILVERKLRFFVLPLGTWWAFMPLLWALAGGCIAGSVLISLEPTWGASLYTQENEVSLVSIGECGVALFLYVVVLLCAAVATSHQPIARNMKGRPFALEEPPEAPLGDFNNPLDARRAVLNTPKKTPLLHKHSSMKQVLLHEVDRIVLVSAHVPYDQVLMDEVPPLLNDLSFLFAHEAWFQPDRALDAKDAFAPTLTSFAFGTGEIIVRNEFEPTKVFDVGGSVGVVACGVAIEILDRRWGRDGQQQYRVVGGGQEWLSNLTTNHFTGSGETSHLFSGDRTVTGEDLLAGMSPNGRPLVRYNLRNGNYASAKNPSKIHPVILVLLVLLSGVISALPCIVRLFRGVAVCGSGTVGEWIAVTCSFALCVMALMSMFVMMHSAFVSFSNLLDVLDCYSRVTLMPQAEHRWFPDFHWLEPINVEAWYFMRDHIVSCHKVALNGRLTACWVAGLAGFLAAAFVCITMVAAPTPAKIDFDGWLASATLTAFALYSPSLLVSSLAVRINKCGAAHISSISLWSVFVNEELAVSEARPSEDIATLLDVQTVIGDVLFVLEHSGAVVAPFGVAMSPFLLRLGFSTHLLFAIPVALLLASSISHIPWVLPSQWV